MNRAFDLDSAKDCERAAPSRGRATPMTYEAAGDSRCYRCGWRMNSAQATPSLHSLEITSNPDFCSHQHGGTEAL